MVILEDPRPVKTPNLFASPKPNSGIVLPPINQERTFAPKVK